MQMQKGHDRCGRGGVFASVGSRIDASWGGRQLVDSASGCEREVVFAAVRAVDECAGAPVESTQTGVRAEIVAPDALRTVG